MPNKVAEKYIEVLNGPNLNLLGRRLPEVYGKRTLDEIMSSLAQRLPPEVALRAEQHNSEGALIDVLHRCGSDRSCMGVVLNAGAYSHYSHAIADAVEAIEIPVVEVHLSNIYARAESFRHTSVLSPVCRACVCGMGEYSYFAAVNYLLGYENKR